jgi:CDP-glucose 4,6-dehydratase
VLEPIGGYLLLGGRLASIGTETPECYCEAWNFGPAGPSNRSVQDLVQATVQAWGGGVWKGQGDTSAPHEEKTLRLVVDKAKQQLGWAPTWTFLETVARTVEWYRLHASGASREELLEISRRQIREYAAAFGGGGEERSNDA